MSTYTYRNPWYSSRRLQQGPEFYTTNRKPIEYRGFQIFHRHEAVYELVKDGVCLTQRAGGGALKSLADALLGDKSDHEEWLVNSARTIGERNGVSFARRAA